jgi:hypothetical protein
MGSAKTMFTTETQRHRDTEKEPSQLRWEQIDSNEFLSGDFPWCSLGFSVSPCLRGKSGVGHTTRYNAGPKYR